MATASSVHPVREHRRTLSTARLYLLASIHSGRDARAAVRVRRIVAPGSQP